ncbi:1-ACYL-SN-GLYCEROL-3-PHOSPHATE ACYLTRANSFERASE ALPHA [Salix viminalis]|uniref:1-ACYL-SN-GLYCEROL-3-PHOSPHATE ACYLTRANSFERASE ALPHA n=1 Tax=Salix viminalis TaxID=40686 RepID=A0A9Q0U6D0_SALVM|nr:1-ACYL-SN-GLYCEROL-3-PHOSPHATE ACYLTRANSFERASE ALPHA [Salix viminalis]
MDNTGGGSFMRNRRLESFLDTNSTANGKQTQKILVREEVVKCSKSDVYVDDDGWISALLYCVRIVVCFLSMMVTTFVWSLILLLLLPWPYERIRQGNIYGHVTGRMLALLALQRKRSYGTLYLDNFMYWQINHLRIDRTNPAAAIQSMKEVAHAVVKNNLSLIIFPEGTRSKDGRLQPFKKGFISFSIADAPPNSSNDLYRLLHDMYVENLPEAQMPLHYKNISKVRIASRRNVSCLFWVCESISKVRIASRRNVSCLFWVCRNRSKVRIDSLRMQRFSPHARSSHGSQSFVASQLLIIL